MKPTTRYTKSGGINIAYQVFGSGSIDLVYIPGWVSNIDLMWECPELVDFLQELGTIARVILFDKRGTGLSDRVVELSTLEERMDDIRAVMDATGSDKAVLFGHSEGGSVSALFAATYPNRVISLITFGIFAKRRYAPDYPWAPTDEERQEVYDMIEHRWGSGEMNLESLAPSKADDSEFMEWLANYFRSGASPSAALALTKMNTQVDIIDILPSINVPTLLMQRTNDIDVKIEEGRFITKRIENARFVEFPGSDHLFWAGNTREVLDEMKAFILNAKPQRNYRVKLFTIAAARFISPHEAQSYEKELITQIVERYRGTIIRFSRDTLITTFEGPSKAVHCCMELAEAEASMGSRLAIGIHIRESVVDEEQTIGQEADQYISSMLQKAGAGEIVITQTVKSLLSGAGLSFEPFNPLASQLDGSDILFSVSDQGHPEATDSNRRTPAAKNDSLLEDVMESIDAHLDDEAFSVDMLCRDIGMSERQLQRKLKPITSKSPIQLISSVRLHRAKELLLTTDHNITEISYRTGFSSPSYFSKCFKKEFGLTPSAMLQKHG